MKIKIKPFTKIIINQNIPYIIIAIVLIVFSAVLPNIVLDKIKVNKAKVDLLNRNIAALSLRKRIIDLASGQKKVDLQQDVKLLQQLVPDAENYFSLINSLDEISKQTGLIITSYTIPFSSSDPEKVIINIAVIGNQNAFINFLNNYNFASGRLVTIDRIELSQTTANAFNLSLNFYHKRATDTSNPEDLIQTIDKINKLKDKIHIVLKEEPLRIEDKNTKIDYPTKNNPF